MAGLGEDCSQIYALNVNGKQVLGKRYYAHNGEDPGAHEPSDLYWFEFKPGPQPEWIPHLIDDSGVGLQVLVQDINGDGLKDILVSNKKGVFFFEAVKN